jgi:hypothetical protein
MLDAASSMTCKVYVGVTLDRLETALFGILLFDFETGRLHLLDEFLKVLLVILQVLVPSDKLMRHYLLLPI